jgi:ATP-dependent RNA helicase RhlE
MHRIGRTGADATGTALSFITPREEESKVEVGNEHGASYRTFPRRS